MSTKNISICILFDKIHGENVFFFPLQRKGQNKPGKSPGAAGFISDSGCADHVEGPGAGAAEPPSLSPVWTGRGR